MVQNFGLRELYVPVADGKLQPDVDIVAVHGLNGDGLKTWTTTSQNICWLNDTELLPNYVKNARVLTYTYNANISSLAGRRTSDNNIMHHAQTLVAELSAERALANATKRPIVFICHSLGGIVVKRALIYAKSRTSRNIAHYHDIYICTYGILFFGTPHAGSSKASLLGSLTKLATLTTPKKVIQIESALVNALQEGSETLQNITDQFAPLLPRFHISFLWEQERTNLGYTKDYIVDESSAAPIIDNTERAGISADHQGMCKFERIDSPGFRLVISIILRYCNEAPQTIHGRVIQASRQLNASWSYEAAESHGPVRKPSIPRNQYQLANETQSWTYDQQEFLFPENKYQNSSPQFETTRQI